tara:strand:- start:6232 stop:6612 length:381 start_codon:yes stop_codon:yes gene_type:complete
MKFQLAKTRRYWWPVKVRVPDAAPENAGQFVEQELKVQFEPLSRDEMIASQEAYLDLTTARDVADFERQQLFRVVKDWDGVIDDDHAPVAFSEEMLATALQEEWFRTGVYAAHAESLGGEAARLGN